MNISTRGRTRTWALATLAVVGAGAGAVAPAALATAPHANTPHAKASHAKASQAKGASLTKAQVIALIKQYGRAGKTGPAGATGATGATGPVGPAGATGPAGAAGTPAPTLAAGAGLLLSGGTFSLDPASTIFQDPLTSHCSGYEFLTDIAQDGTPTCDYAVVADVRNVSPTALPSAFTANTETTIASDGVGSAEYWLDGSTTLENTGGSAATVTCRLAEGTTVYALGYVTIPAGGYESESLTVGATLNGGLLQMQCETSASTVSTLATIGTPQTSLAAINLANTSTVTTGTTS